MGQIWFSQARNTSDENARQNKLLLDPYGYGHTGNLTWNPAIFGYQIETLDGLAGTLTLNSVYSLTRQWSARWRIVANPPGPTPA
jgi:hypothetical protein